jgi:hypothetical protein
MTEQTPEWLKDEIVEAIRGLEELEAELYGSEQQTLRKKITDIRSNLAGAAMRNEYLEQLDNADVGDTLFFNEVERSVTNLDDE